MICDELANYYILNVLDVSAFTTAIFMLLRKIVTLVEPYISPDCILITKKFSMSLLHHIWRFLKEGMLPENAFGLRSVLTETK